MIIRYDVVMQDCTGALSRVLGLFRRNGWNVERLHLEPIPHSEHSSLSMEVSLPASAVYRLEQMLHDWDFIVQIKQNVDKEGIV